MNRLIFLLEERSMRVLLEGLIPRLFPNLTFLCVPHEGKNDLEKSIPRKLKAWREPGAQFLVLLDNDGGDCLQTKRKFSSLCKKAGRSETVVRIACQELEAWYLGEPSALAAAFVQPKLSSIATQSRFRESDSVLRPSAELAKLLPEFQKVSGARRMAKYLSREHNRSRSFQVLLEAIERAARQISDKKEDKGGT